MEKRVKVWVQRFKDRSTLMLQWIDPETGRRKTKSAETDDEETAETKRGDLEYRLNHGQYQEASKLNWENFRQMFQDEYLPGVRERTREKYNTVLDVFEQIICPAKLRAVNERTISRFVKGMRERRRSSKKIGLASQTIKNYLIAIKSALAWAVDQKLMAELPKFPMIKVPKKKPQPIPAESWERLLAKAPDEFWKAYLMCGWWAGLRLSEALHLRWDRTDELPWVNFEGGRIVLPAVFVKADVDQRVPLHPVLRQALAALPRRDGQEAVFDFRSHNGKPLSRSSMTHHVLAIAKNAGVKLSMHKLRKGFGCHSSMQVTMDYYASVDGSLHEAINELT